MSLFKSQQAGRDNSPGESLPVSLFDFSKRYDLYCWAHGEDRLYEDVKIIGIRTFQLRKGEFRADLIGGYIEVEGRNGARLMLPHLRLQMICEHGVQPAYKVLRVHRTESGE